MDSTQFDQKQDGLFRANIDIQIYCKPEIENPYQDYGISC